MSADRLYIAYHQMYLNLLLKVTKNFTYKSLIKVPTNTCMIRKPSNSQNVPKFKGTKMRNYIEVIEDILTCPNSPDGSL